MSKFKGFDSVELHKPKRSLFDLSHERRLSTRMGRLTPVFISETMPNDTWKVNSEIMLRMAPLLAPIMHMVNVYVHFFYIPNRLLWKDWELFITNGRLGTETPPVPPNAGIGAVCNRAKGLLDVKSLCDYLGLPPIPDADTALWGARSIDLMPVAACYKVWYDYYRDRNYVADDTILPLPSGNTATAATLDAIFKIYNRDWEHDYYTSALSWTQRGNQVLMPLVGSGTVTYLPESILKTSAGANPNINSLVGTNNTSPTFLRVNKTAAGVDGISGRVENIDSIDLSASSTINDFRRAMRLQEWMERQALAGSRYNETIWAHFNRKTSDARLQRAEYLGGGKVNVKISEVVTTAYSEDGGANVVPPANMAGHGLTFGNTNQFKYNCEEHGFIVGFMSVLPTSGYMQGAPRMFFGRNTFLDYPWPSFAHLGEQPVYNYEIYGTPTSVPVDRTTQPVFGYQSRYVDWKNMSSSCHGDFRTTLDFWHLTRKFSSQPVLGATFTNFEDTLQDRIFAVSGGDTLWCYIHNQVTVVRSLPYFGTPML